MNYVFELRIRKLKNQLGKYQLINSYFLRLNIETIIECVFYSSPNKVELIIDPPQE